MIGTTIELQEVWSNRNGVSGCKVIYRPHRLALTACPDSGRHWHTLLHWQPAAQPWIKVYEAVDFHAYGGHDILNNNFGDEYDRDL